MAKNRTSEVDVAETPIGGNLTEEQRERIRQRAHDLYMARGQEDGHDLEDWLQAKAEMSTAEKLPDQR